MTRLFKARRGFCFWTYRVFVYAVGQMDTNSLAALPIRRNRALFLKELLSEVSDALESRLGPEEAESLIAVVGGRIGEAMDREYKSIFELERFNAHQIAHLLVDLKSRIDGGFAIESIDDEKIVLVNDQCPFGEHVNGRPAFCMMTSNVFGWIAAKNLGYASVELAKTLAEGHGGCRVVIHLDVGKPGREYFA